MLKLIVSDLHEWISNHERKSNPNPIRNPNQPNPNRDPNPNSRLLVMVPPIEYDRCPCNDSRHVTAPYKLALYYYYY